MSTISYTPNAPIQYTGPIGRVLSVSGNPISRVDHRPQLQTRTITARLTGRGLRVSGVAVPYDTVVSDGGYGKEIFTVNTQWELAGPTIPLKANHSTYLGTARVVEKPWALLVDGHVLGGMRKFAADKRWFSIGFTTLEERRRPDGVVERLAVILFEVSLVPRGAHEPLTFATINEADD